jgi:hypothetical protein
LPLPRPLDQLRADDPNFRRGAERQPHRVPAVHADDGHDRQRAAVGADDPDRLVRLSLEY